MKPIFPAALIAATVVAAGPALAQAAPATPTYLMKAGASDLYEKQSSQLVLQSTKDAKLKTFANEMIRDHTKSTADVKAAAAQAKLTVAPPKLDAEQAKMIGDLRGAKGTARDKLYVQQQKTAHAKALQLHQSYAAGGDTPSLKAAAGKIAPVVQHHIEMLGTM